LQVRGLRWSCYKDEASRRGSVCLPSPASFRHGGWWWQPQSARLPARSMVATVMECEARVSALWEMKKMMTRQCLIGAYVFARISAT